ncbi:MAG: hypothetical protein NW203_13120 [Hyphomonadaceae bacterium]|nr:hypothetical protein [Hyphomonadaceae bacterium]
MNTARAIEILEAYGADAARWPEAERDGVLAALAAGDGDVAAALAQARVLDAALACDASEPQRNDLLAARILRAAPAAPSLPRAAPLAALAACAALGVAIGFGGARYAAPEGMAEAALAAAFADEAGGFGLLEGGG